MHKDTTKINKSDESIERFSVSGGNTMPKFKNNGSILDNMSKTIQFTMDHCLFSSKPSNLYNHVI